jgi:response regulator RpfG family c-di-GMP phosphodiesterase
MARFLVVDDDDGITGQVQRALKSWGHEAQVANDPREVVDATGFQVVMVDFMMPHLNGIELLRKLKPRNPHAVRVLMTAANDFKVALDAVNQGEIFRLLSKPWQLIELKDAVTQASQYHAVRAENHRLTTHLAERNAALTRLNETLEAQIVERTSGLLEGMVRALDYRDTETQWHSRRVSLFTRRLAQAAGVDGMELEVIEQGALLHDIGKIGVRDSVLLKPGPLTPEEWVEMKRHPEIGWRMLNTIPYLRGAAEIVYQHQEKWNGQGYPRGLQGEAIVFGARAFCIADTLDAITSDRPYRKGSPIEVALAEIGRLAGSQFDPTLVELFLSLDKSEWLLIREQVELMEAAAQPAALAF